MPCRGPDDDLPRGPDPRVPRLERELKLQAAMLCGILTVLEKDGVYPSILGSVDWDEVGMKRAEFEAWWNNHKAQDAARRIKENAGKLPFKQYQIRDEVNFQDRDWFVTKITTAGGETTVHMVTADDKYPIRKEPFKVRKQ